MALLGSLEFICGEHQSLDACSRECVCCAVILIFALSVMSSNQGTRIPADGDNP